MDSTTTVTHDTRTERDAHCDGLQAMVDLLRAHPELKSPFSDALQINNPVHWTPDPKAQMAAWARATAHLKPRKSYETHASLLIQFGPDVLLHVYAAREQVCERVVTGTRQVTETVKDPEMLAAVPEVEVTREVEDVEWICAPLLAVAEDVPA